MCKSVLHVLIILCVVIATIAPECTAEDDQKRKASKPSNTKQTPAPFTGRFPPTAFQYAQLAAGQLGVPPKIDLSKAIEIPLYVDGVRKYGNLGRECDNPTFLGKDTISGSTLQRHRGMSASGKPLPDVTWVSFARNSSPSQRHVVGSVQMIGYNKTTGASAFFESSDRIEPWVRLDKGTLRMRGVLPGIDEPAEFNKAFKTPGNVQCVQCHQNDPFITNSFINAAKLPGTGESVVPALDQDSPYYVIGGENWDMRTIHIEGNACFDCHRVGQGTLQLFMSNGWEPNQHMPPHAPGSLAKDLKQVLKVLRKGPANVTGASWIIPPARDQDQKTVGADYPYQASFNRLGISKRTTNSLDSPKDLEQLAKRLKEQVQSGELSEEEAIKIYFSKVAEQK